MAEENTPKRPGEHLLSEIEALLPAAKLLSTFNPEARAQLRDLEKQHADVKQMLADIERFVKIYAPLGWTNYDDVSTELVSKIVRMEIADGEAALTDYHLDHEALEILDYRFFKACYSHWAHIFKRAVERAGQADYISAIPLILIIIDGIFLSNTGKHPFSGGADAPVFDTQSSRTGGLPDGLALLGSVRRKLDVEPISLPFRHGIIHGLNPNYGTAQVAAKAFNLLRATMNYFDRKNDEAERLESARHDQKPIEFRDLMKRKSENAAFKTALQNWRARDPVSQSTIAESGDSVKLSAGSPEAFVVDYLELLRASNYGGLAKATVDFLKRPIGLMAGRFRNELEGVSLHKWKITGVEDSSAAMSFVIVQLVGTIHDAPWEGEYKLRLLYSDDDYNSLARGMLGGGWSAMGDFLSELWRLSIAPST